MALGVIAVATPQFVYSYGDAAPEESCSPLRTLQGLGFRVPGNSDSTGTQPEAANPFHSIWCALAHRTRGGSTIEEGERIGLDAAIRSFTADAAFACRMADRGALAPGALADFLVLGEDPWNVPEDELPAIPVDLTVIGGRVVWEGTR
jgi:predicted amidohydrolase YtcJ